MSATGSALEIQDQRDSGAAHNGAFEPSRLSPPGPVELAQAGMSVDGTTLAHCKRAFKALRWTLLRRNSNQSLFVGARAMRLISTQNATVNSGVFGDFEIAATMLPVGAGAVGWRITTIDRTSGLQHEFFVQERQIHLVQFRSSPPWDHSTQFIVGGKVKRILHAEKRAILQALAGWQV